MVKSGRLRRSIPIVRHDESDVENDVDIPQSRSVHVSADGQRVIESSREPQLHFSGSQAVKKTSTYSLYNPHTQFDAVEVEPVAAKLAAKRYPTSVRTPRPLSFDHDY